MSNPKSTASIAGHPIHPMLIPFPIRLGLLPFSASHHMSAVGTKRTSTSAPHTSAFGGEADMTFCTANVCL